MPTVYKRKGMSGRGGWSEDSLRKAVKAVENKEMVVNAAAKAFGIPKTTLKRRLKSHNFDKGSMGKKLLLEIENETKIVGHIKKLQSKGFTPTRDSVRSMAYYLAENLQLKHNFNHETKQAGYDWLSSFLLRNPELSIRQAEGVSIARAKGLNKKVVKEYFDLLKSVLEENGLIDKPGNIFNMDETGLQLNNKPGKVVALKGSKNVTSVTSGEKGETISVLTCVNGEGRFLPPFCIMKGKNLKQEFCDGLPPGAEVKMSPKSGYVNSDLFFDWMKTHFTPRKPVGKVLLLLDGHTSHTSCVEMLEFAENNDIILMSIPPHTSHWLQPLDRAFFKSLKMNYYSACSNYMTNNPSRKITRLQFGALLSLAWGKSANVDNGISGFRTCGIIPFEPDAIPDYAFLSESEDLRPLNASLVSQNDKTGVDVVGSCTSRNDISVSNPKSSKNEVAVGGPSCSKNDSNAGNSKSHKNDYVPESSKQSENTSENVTPSKILDEIHPVPCVNKVQTLKRKAQSISTILSSPENIIALKKKKDEKELNIKIKEEKKKDREEKKKDREEKKKETEKKKFEGERENKKQTKINKRKRTQKTKALTSSSESEDIDINTICNDNLYESDWDEDNCVWCKENYSETKRDEDWIRCVSCSRWTHEGCTRFENKCDYCGKKDSRQKVTAA